MTHDRPHAKQDAPATDSHDADPDAPLDPAKPATGEEQPNVLLREGSDAPDAADIEDPETQL
jgi:hypothetical protein